MQVSYVSIVTSDVDWLCAFYTGIVGLTEFEDWRHDGFRALDAGRGCVLALHSRAAYAEMGLEPPADGANTLVTFDPGSQGAVDAESMRLVMVGVTWVRRPFDTPYGSRQAIFRDPDGNPFRLNSF